MPESNHPNRIKQEYTLGNAHDIGMLVKIKCRYCRIIRHYPAGDVMQICGNVPLKKIASQFRCEKCGHKDYMDADFYLPWPAEIGKLQIKRLERIKLIRKPVWRDDVY